MTLTTVSKVRNRAYARHFDHDECRRLRAEDPKKWSYSALAAHFGVSVTGVQRVCDERFREKLDNSIRQANRRRRRPCKGGCGRLVWLLGEKARTTRSGMCPRCFAIARVQADVRADSLRCLRCGLWKPDEEFTKRPNSNWGRRNHLTRCRSCETKARTENRRRNPERELAYERRYYHEVRRERRGVMAEYVVLQRNGQGSYREVERVDAVSPKNAIEQAASEEGEYVGVLASRFEVVEVGVRSVFKVLDE